MKRIFAMGVLLIAASVYVFGECSEADKNNLEAFDRAWSDAGLKGDRASLMNIYSDDYVGMPAMQNKTATIENTMRTFEADKTNPSGDKTAQDNYMITCTPSSAVVTHRNIYTTKNGAGKEETFWSRSVHFLEKRDGKWQVVGNTAHNLDESAIVGYMSRDWMDAQKNRDVSWSERNLAADFSGIDTGGGFVGKTGLLAEFKAGAGKPGWGSSEVSQLNVRVEGNTGVATGVLRVKGLYNGQPYEQGFRFTDTYIKRDGRWQLLASQGTSIPQARATQ